ncbi:hypothetical protein Golax_019732 [Gossypium laxum]|uniref:Uncharacterized protein n=1 Tax=Gossypium laxum TaxID=34288 RepID=A0A7J8Z7C3_9ROSI|nr:hypothetical protein [Gossypium laxum]
MLSRGVPRVNGQLAVSHASGDKSLKSTFEVDHRHLILHNWDPKKFPRFKFSTEASNEQLFFSYSLTVFTVACAFECLGLE